MEIDLEMLMAKDAREMELLEQRTEVCPE